MIRARAFSIVALASMAMAFGCWPRKDQPPAGHGAGGQGLVVETGAPPSAWKGGRGIVILDPLDWSGKYLEINGLKLERRDGCLRVPLDDGEHAADALAGAILALRRRMAVIAENVANAETTRLPGAAGAGAEPYRRKVLTVAPSGALEVDADESAFRRTYRPTHRDADKDGQVLLPNVYVEVEQADWRASVREYEALRQALALVSTRYAAPPAELLPVPAPPPAYEEKPAPPTTPGPATTPVAAPPEIKPAPTAPAAPRAG